MKLINVKTVIFILSVLLLATLQSNAYAQKNELKVGDQVPEIMLGKVINYKKSIVKISDFSNRLLILDFWNRGCASCIAAMPHMDSLQRFFGEKLMILPVTNEPESEIRSFWKANAYTNRTSLPTVTEDKVLASHFRHWGFPHEVWIFKGKVIAITGAEYVDKHNIQKILNGEQISWPVKNDYQKIVNKPLFALDDNQLDASNTSFQYAALSGFTENPVENGIFRDRQRKTVRYTFVNQTIFSAYRLAYSGIGGYKFRLVPSRIVTPNQISWQVADRSKYEFIKVPGNYLAQWKKDNGISYESLRPDTGQSDKQLWQAMVTDLNSLLGMDVRWERMNATVFVLENSKIATPVKKIQGKSYALAEVWNGLNAQENNPYVYIDEEKVRSDKKVLLDIKSWKDVLSIKKQLEAQGYTLREEIRLIDKWVFKEVDYGLVLGKRSIEIQNKKIQQKGMKDPTAGENSAFMESNKKKTGVVTLPSGLQYKVISNGIGPKPQNKDLVIVDYLGTLVNGKIFDSSYEYIKPLEINIDNEELIKGWKEILQLMPVGSKWEVYIPAELAYRGRSNYGRIPPNSNLIFEMELVGIKENKK